MKKKLFSLLAFAFLVAGTLTACNSPSNISGQFNLENYVVSIDDTINFFDDFSVIGTEKENIDFSTSNETILEETQEGKFEAKKSGETYVFAKYKEKIVAQTKVFVRYKFSSPQNIQIDANGKVTWDKSFITIGKETFFANSYHFTYSKYNEEGTLGTVKQETCTENNFTLSGIGSYNVKIQAVGDSEKDFEPSAQIEIDLNNGVVGQVKNGRLAVSQNIKDQNATFSWESPNSNKAITYDVYLEGFKIESDLTESEFSFDYSRFAGGSALELTIEAKDESGMLLSTKTKYTLHKLSTPTVEYKFENNNGFVECNGSAKASAYKVKVTNFQGQSKILSIDSCLKFQEYLEGFDRGLYNIEVMAVGKNNGFYLNSDTTSQMTFTKLGTPNVESNLVDNNLVVEFPQQAYSTKYRVECAGLSYIYDTANGFSTTIELSRVPNGKYTLKITALPKEDGESETGVAPLETAQITNARIINSDPYTFDFYVLKEMGELKHSLDGTISTISLTEIKNANTYNLYVNDVFITDTNLSVESGKAIITFENLSQIAPIDNKYTFRVEAKRVENDKLLSTIVENTKTIEILSVVQTSENQENGFYTWNGVDGSAEYYYEVFMTDETYTVNESDQPVLKGTTDAAKTSPILELGHYYVVKIFTQTTDANQYLNANFYDENAFFSANFIATKQIETPQLSFSDENEQYSLTISAVEYGGKYEVFVDGALDGEIVVDELKEEYVYYFDTSFEEAKEYSVTVVASSGLIFDSNLYVPSQENLIFIERLAQTSFTMDYPKDLFGRKTNENLTFNQNEKSVAVNVVLGGVSIMDEGYVLDLMDYSKFGKEFSLTSRYIATEPEENKYYLDSIPLETKFERTIAPSNITYNSGIVNWTGATAGTFDYYEAVLTVVNSQASNFYYTLQIGSEYSQYDIQTLIDTLISSNPTIASAYRQADKLQVQLYSFDDGEEDGVYKLPSLSGVTTKGAVVLDIFKLQKPVMKFDPQTQILSWDEEVSGSTYDIYVDGNLIVEKYSSNSINLAQLGTYDYLTEKKLCMQAFNSAYLDSDMSDEISIEEIEIGNTLAITKNATSYIATFNILNDQTHISEVWVNGTKANVEYVQGSSSASFDFANYVGNTTFTIFLKALNEVEGIYYLDSKEITFTIENLANKDFEYSTYEAQNEENISEDYVQWTEFRDSFAGNSLQPLVYTVYVENGTNTYHFISEECSFNLEQIEQIIKVKLSGQVKVYITASIEKDYVLTGENSFGFYGSVTTATFTTQKLEQIEIADIKVVDGNKVSDLEKKIYSGIEISFEDKWSGLDKLIFKVTAICNQGSVTYQSNYSLEDASSNSIVLKNGMYYLTYNMFTEMQNDGFKPFDFTIKLTREQTINADKTDFVVERFDTTQNSVVSDDGSIQFNDPQENASYFLELKIADKIIYKPILASEMNSERIVDLMGDDFFGGVEESGNYQISILAFDENERKLPSFVAEVLTGYKLAGLSNIAITDEGNVTFSMLLDDLDGLIFNAKIESNGLIFRHDFTAKAVEDSNTDFYISMLDILELFDEDLKITSQKYDFGFTVRKTGSINANWLEFSFNYQEGDSPSLVRGRELENDYILFDLDATSIKTTAFSVKVTGLFAYEEVVEEDTEEENPIPPVDPDGWTQINETTGEDTTDGNENVEDEGSTENGGNTTTTVRKVRKETREYYFYPEDIKGFWVTDSEGKNGYYNNAQGSEANLVYNQYFVVSVRELLSEVAFGDLTIKIARVGKAGEEYYQYNPTTYNLHKLNSVDEQVNVKTNRLSISENVLSWKWVQQEAGHEEIAPTSYYIILEDLIFGTVTKNIITASSVDLRTIGVIENRVYNVSVIALNFNTNIVASNGSATIYTMKYSKPISLDVVDGKLQFKASEFASSSFMKDIKEFFAEESPEQTYHDKVGLNPYMSPFFFAPQTLSTAMMQIKFTSVVEGGSTHVIYKLKVPATVLFPDVVIPFASSIYAPQGMTTYEDSYVALLQRYSALYLSSPTTLEEQNTKDMIEAIITSNLGIGDGAILVDDVARSLPEGEYQISVSQIGESNFVESVYSKSIKVYISASPEISLQTEEIDGKTCYTAVVTPTMNMLGDKSSGYVKGFATRYKMQLRYQPTNNMYSQNDFVDFIIGYSGTDWHISYNETTLDGVISSVEWAGSEVPKFRLNMTNLRKEMSRLGFDVLVANELINVNIFTYSQDDGYVINGKSAKFDLNYLDLIAENISFTNGEFVIIGPDNHEMLVKYKISSQTENSFTQNFVDGQVVLSFGASGVYEYITLALNGSISSSMMNVASESYVIKGLYKLNAPTLTTRNNNISISYNSNDIRYMSTLKFNMANDISLKDKWTGDDKGYYFTSDITSSDSVIPYVVGSRNAYGDTVYPSELMAEKFFAYLSGNSGEFAVSNETVTEGDKLLAFYENNEASRAIMSSPEASIEAIMLPYLGGFGLKDGNLELDCRMVGIDAITNANADHLSANVVYEIIVKYYGFDNTYENGNVLMELAEETHYSERTKASDYYSIMQIVDSSFVNPNYDYFTFSVTTLGALRVSSDNPNAIETLEGTYILLTDSVFYGANPQYPNAPYGAHVLRSQDLSTPILTRTKAPYLASGSNGVLNGKLQFVIDSSLFYADNSYYADDLQVVAQDTANRLRIRAEYPVADGIKNMYIGGSINFSIKSDLGEENNIYITFTPEEGLFADAIGAIKFYITIHGKDPNNYNNPAITSLPLIIDNVYKLPSMEEKYYEVQLIGDKTYLNFSKYFENIAIANDYSCYKVVVLYMIDGSDEVYAEEITYSSEIKRFELYSDATVIQIQIQDGQDSTTLNPKKLLYSDASLFAIEKTSIEDLNVTWNSQTLSFEWNWTNGSTDEYEYYVTVNFKEGHSESEIVSTNYYMIQNSGTIESGGFEIRARKKASGTNNLYSFSDRKVYEGETISVSLYSGGNGSINNPYTIANEIDFANITKRNTLDRQFYFKLGGNITIDMSSMYTEVAGEIKPIIPEFYGVLDGNGYKMTIISSTAGVLNENYDATLTGMSSLKFTQYSSLFHTVSAVASIKNLYIDYSLAYNKLDSSNVLFASICAYNYGTIDNINLSSFAISNLSGKGTNNAFVGGLVGVNYGLISNCQDASTISYSMAQQLSMNFGFAGISAFNGYKNNISGTITNCFSRGDKQVTVTVNNNVVYLAGITLANGGKISLSGNDSNLRLNSRGAGVTTYTGYMAGVTVTSNGTLEYLYNNGLIENLSTYGTLNFGGVAYAITGGTINTLVETNSAQPLVKSCTTKPTILGSNYAGQSSNTHTFIPTKELASVTLTCTNGYVLKISSTDDGYKATIVKA